jgi:hypothetical protein
VILSGPISIYTSVPTETISFSLALKDISTSGVLSLTISNSAVPEKTSCHLSINTSETVPLIGDLITSFPKSLDAEL